MWMMLKRLCSIKPKIENPLKKRAERVVLGLSKKWLRGKLCLPTIHKKSGSFYKLNHRIFYFNDSSIFFNGQAKNCFRNFLNAFRLITGRQRPYSFTSFKNNISQEDYSENPCNNRDFLKFLSCAFSDNVRNDTPLNTLSN